MAVVISFLRVLYDSRETKPRRILLESLICGCLSLVSCIVIDWMEWPPSLSIAAGETIGFLGVTAIRELMLRFINLRFE